MEFALVVIPLLLILFGIVGFGMTLWSYQGLQAAAREGARVASLPTSSRADITATLDTALQGVLWAPAATSGDVQIAGDCATGAEQVRVSIRAADSFGEIPLAGIALPRPEAHGSFRCE